MNEEAIWIAQAQQGSDEAFTRLVEAYQTHVYNLCHRMLGEAESAEDASQETFLRAYQHLHRYDCNRPFATWLLSIAAHYCIDRLRRQRLPILSLERQRGENGPEWPDGNMLPEDEMVYSEQRHRVQNLLTRLEPTDRAAIILRYWHEASEAEIAQALNLTVSAVKSRLHRARRRLAELWREEAPPPKPQRRPHESPAF